MEFIAELPKTGTGKLQRFALRQMAQAVGWEDGGGMNCLNAILMENYR